MSERNRKMVDEIASLNKERKRIQTFADVARAETKNLVQQLRDYNAALGVSFRQLKEAEKKLSFSTIGLSEAVGALLIDLHNAEIATSTIADRQVSNDALASNVQVVQAATRFLDAVRSISRKSQ
jgi:hypothetical protein